MKLVYEIFRYLPFQVLLPKENSDGVQQKNCYLLATDVLTSETGMTPDLLNDTFHFEERPYRLRSNYRLEGKRDHSVYRGSENLSSLAPKLWHLLTSSIHNSASLKEFKTKTHAWTADHFPYRIHKKYVGRVGFIQVVPQILHFRFCHRFTWPFAHPIS